LDRAAGVDGYPRRVRLERGGPVTPEEALATILAEGLGRYRWFEDATNDADSVAIQRTVSGWVVFATYERATPQGRR
ncbi:hypothetical protein, partial [Klebsiella pneumoniae]|uniref:hypothetical protein n=1 Tax=Klebsiella pneumoniae TaxID=573 RepID=UPI00385277DB